MPEGPEIRRAADKVAAVLVGKRIEDVEFGLADLRRYEGQLSGRTVTAVDTRGKAMLTRFDNALTIYSHNQLYGRWYTVRRPRTPKTGRQLRVALSTDTHKALLYSASDIAVLDDAGLSRHPFLQRVGPDILDRTLTAADIVERLQAQKFRNRALGSLYLDQSFLAGNGNYLRSEILWAARVDPKQRPSQLPTRALNRLARETLKIARRSYRTRGITVAPTLARELKDRGENFEALRFNVYGREGKACRECGSTIERREMGSRSLFVCNRCQAA